VEKVGRTLATSNASKAGRQQNRRVEIIRLPREAGPAAAGS
jgi:flagellar motor protein MotB